MIDTGFTGRYYSGTPIMIDPYLPWKISDPSQRDNPDLMIDDEGQVRGRFDDGIWYMDQAWFEKLRAYADGQKTGQPGDPPP